MREQGCDTRGNQGAHSLPSQPSGVSASSETGGNNSEWMQDGPDRRRLNSHTLQNLQVSHFFSKGALDPKEASFDGTYKTG